jgi:hypothetical protein
VTAVSFLEESFTANNWAVAFSRALPFSSKTVAVKVPCWAHKKMGARKKNNRPINLIDQSYFFLLISGLVNCKSGVKKG